MFLDLGRFFREMNGVNTTDAEGTRDLNQRPIRHGPRARNHLLSRDRGVVGAFAILSDRSAGPPESGDAINASRPGSDRARSIGRRSN